MRQAALQSGAGVVKGDYALMADAAAEASLRAICPKVNLVPNESDRATLTQVKDFVRWR